MPRIRTRKPTHKHAQLVYTATPTKETPRHVTDSNAGNREEMNNLLQVVFGKKEKESCMVD